jgi:sugar/nucleoside kinase (ribokinase family)
VNLVVFGSITMDLTTYAARLPRLGEILIGDTFRLAPGGKGANMAVDDSDVERAAQALPGAGLVLLQLEIPLAVTRAGAMPSMPSRAELEALLNQEA